MSSSSGSCCLPSCPLSSPPGSPAMAGSPEARLRTPEADGSPVVGIEGGEPWYGGSAEPARPMSRMPEEHHGRERQLIRHVQQFFHLCFPADVHRRHYTPESLAA